MTAVLDATDDAAAQDDAPAVRLASWPARAAAFTVDVLCGVAVIATMALLALSAPVFGAAWWVFTAGAALTFIAMAVNRLLLPAMRGWSLGRALAGIRVVRGDGDEAALWRLCVRELAHVLDTAALLLGWLWPLWDRRNRTFADLLLRTEAHAVERPQRDMRRLSATVLAAAVLVCAAATGLGYLTVYRPQRATDAARDQIATEGPRIVEQMLSYSAPTMKDDFARAQSLTTDSYRAQLAAQQQAVQKGGATTNEYWAVSSAVLSASPDRAAMLLAVQGQRGADAKNLKFITATVRVEFERAGDGPWRVANLTVLKKPILNHASR